MVVWVEFDGLWVQLDRPVSINDIKNEVLSDCNSSDIYVTYNGRIFPGNATIDNGVVRATRRILGGKGGFGSMLRAIGAQIEKTTNREACRDLSGRRLRDINEEKRLKNWIAQQAEREQEAADRRKKKLERLCFEPKHDFQDQKYEKARTELTEKVYDAVEQGFRSASTSTNGLKRNIEPQGTSQPKKKKTCLWVDDVDEDDLSSLDSDSDSETKSQTDKKGENADEKCSEKLVVDTLNRNENCDKNYIGPDSYSPKPEKDKVEDSAKLSTDRDKSGEIAEKDKNEVCVTAKVTV